MRRRRLVALALLASLAAAGCGGPSAPHGIVLVVLDTLRADGLSVYGNPRPTSPNIDRLAAEGVLFEQAMSHTSWTLPGFVGLLSGSPPSVRVYDRRLRRSLVEELARAGYATAAFTEGGYVSRHFGMDLGFAHFEDAESKVCRHDAATRARPGHTDRGAAHTIAAADGWLREHASQPFALLVHTIEVHTPYRGRTFAEGMPRGAIAEEYSVEVARAVEEGRLAVGETEIAYVRALYDGGVASADREVGRLLGTLDELGIADRTLVVLTSDHGEELGEREGRLGVHGKFLWDVLLRVPLIVRDPLRDFPVRRVPQQVRLVDVLPTILDLAGIPVPPDVEGRSLVPLMEGRERAGRPLVAEVTDPRSKVPRRVALRQEGWKLVVNLPPLEIGQPPSQLFHVAEDPGETRDLAAQEAARKDAMFERLRERRGALGGTASPELTAGEDAPPRLREQLRALGYAE